MSPAPVEEWVATFSHELRNPLTIIETTASLLRTELGENGVAKSHLDRIENQVRAASGIISSMLERVNEQPTQCEPLVLAEVVHEALMSLEVPAHLTLTVEDKRASRTLVAERLPLRLAFINLFKNAFEAIPGGGKVRVTFEDTPTGAAIHFDDTGPGVLPSVRARLFEGRVTLQENGKLPGLVQVKQFIECHHGHLSYSPSDLGGARFTLAFPGGAPF